MPDDLEELFRFEEESPCEEARRRAAKDTHDRAVVHTVPERTFVLVLVVHEDPNRNELTRIHCKKGLPISGYVYDTVTESYHVECVEYMQLGFVPVSMQQTMPGVGRWVQNVPMPEQALRRFFTPQQKRDLRQLKATYKDGRHRFEFLQIIDAY